MLALEGQRRGHALFHYVPKDLSFTHGRVHAKVRPFTVRRDPADPFTVGAAEKLDLATVDVVLMRQDPPFDMAYITATHILEHIHPETLVVNDPVSVRNAPEKLFVTHFPDLMPPTLISSNRRRDRGLPGRAQGSSSSSRCSAMAARACSISGRTTKI